MKKFSDIGNENLFFITTLLLYSLVSFSIYIFSKYRGLDGIYVQIFGNGDDGVHYWNMAIDYINGNIIRFSLYPFILSKIMEITNIIDPIIFRVFNLLIFFLLLWKLRELVRIVSDYHEISQNSNIIIYLFLLFYLSLQATINISIIRDVWLYYLFISIIIKIIKISLLKQKGFNLFIFLILDLILLYVLREYMFGSLIFAYLLFLFFSNFSLIIQNKVTYVILIVLFFVFLIFKNNIIIFMNFVYEKVINYRNYFIFLHPGGSQMFLELDINKPILSIYNYILSFIGNFIGPFFWFFNSRSMIIVFIFETIPFVLIFSQLVSKIDLASKLNQFLLFQSFVWISIISITNDNFGTASRLRIPTWLILIVLFSVNYKRSFLNNDE